MTEIRANDLRFSATETADFVRKCVGRPVADSAALALEKKTEGWPAALRLASLSVKNDPDPGRIISKLPEDNQYVADYIVNEVITQQPSEIQNLLLRTSLLNRFCIPLCDALCPSGEEPNTCDIGGREFIRWLTDANLFVIPLDSQNRWFRYHHLFQHLLHRRLDRQLDEAEIRQLHELASEWFIRKDLIDEALHHCLKACDLTGAARLVAESRHDLINREQWNRLQRWIEMLPKSVVDADIELLLTKAWLYENRLQLTELIEVMGRIETMKGTSDTAPEDEHRIEGEYNALKAAVCYLGGDGPTAVSYASRSIHQIPENHSSELAFALIVRAFGLQMVGDGARGRQVILEALSRAGRHVRTYHARLLFGLCFLDWLEADMRGVRQTAEQVIMFGREHELLESLSFGHYFMGLALYHLNDLSGAEAHLQDAVEKGKATNINTFAHASYLLALTHQALGKTEAAKEVAQAVMAYALISHNSLLIQDAKAFQAELALRQNRLPEVCHWAKTYDPFPLSPVVRYYLPPLTLLKFQITQGSLTSLMAAIELADRFIDYYAVTNNSRVPGGVVGFKGAAARKNETYGQCTLILAESSRIIPPRRKPPPFH